MARREEDQTAAAIKNRMSADDPLVSLMTNGPLPSPEEFEQNARNDAARRAEIRDGLAKANPRGRVSMQDSFRAMLAAEDNRRLATQAGTPATPAREASTYYDEDAAIRNLADGDNVGEVDVDTLDEQAISDIAYGHGIPWATAEAIYRENIGDDTDWGAE